MLYLTTVAGANNGNDPGIIFQDMGVSQRLATSGALTQDIGGRIRRECVLRLIRPVPMIVLVAHEEREQEDSSNLPNERLGHIAPDLSASERDLEVRDLGELENRGIVAESLQEAPTEDVPESSQIGEDLYGAIQSEGSHGECRSFSKAIACINFLQSWIGQRGRTLLRGLRLLSTRRPGLDLVLSRLSCLLLLPITRPARKSPLKILLQRTDLRKPWLPPAGLKTFSHV